MSFRNVCVTLNNPDDADKVCEDLRTYEKVSYFVMGWEVGALGTPHLQGYIEFKAPIRLCTLQRLIPGGHFEQRRGSGLQASQYCKKGEQSKEEWAAEGSAGPNFGQGANVQEFGELKQQGKSFSLRDATDLIKSGSSLRSIATESPEIFVRHHKGLMALQCALVEPRTEKPNVFVYHGLTGSGKSRLARESVKSTPYVWHPQQGQWWDGYAGQESVIMEEFRGQLPFGMLLSLLDRYDCKVQFKGGVMEFRATDIHITSPLPPTQWYQSDKLQTDDSVEQLLRRITKVIHVKKLTTKRRLHQERGEGEEDVGGTPSRASLSPKCSQPPTNSPTTESR